MNEFFFSVYDFTEPEATLSMDNASFSWGQGESPVLSNINLRVGRGRLVAVVGSVGAGKSSLVSALLGEMQKQSGRVNSVVSRAVTLVLQRD